MVTTKVFIINAFLFILTFDFGYSSFNPKDIVFNETAINQTACQSRKCIRKCCPKGQYVYGNNCTSNSTGNFDVDKISVYDDYYRSYKIDKNFSDIFLLVPGRFLEVIAEINNTFANKSTNTETLPTYLTESGQLYIRFINSYEQWNPIPDFCIDYDITFKKTTFFCVFNENPTDNEAKDNYYIVGMLISSVFLGIVLLVYILLPELRNLAGLILMAYVLSLMSAFILVTTLKLSSYSILTCVCLSALTYFFFLATYCWMNIMSFDIWWTFRGFAKTRPIHTRGRKRTFALYCLYGWGIPFLMAVGFVTLTQVDMSSIPSFVTPHIPDQGCFLTGGQKLLYLYIPMLILIISNWMFFLMTVFNMWRLHRSTSMLDSRSAGSPATHRKQNNRLLVYLKLSAVMGINWILDIGSYLAPNLQIWVVTDSYNLFIGLFIFFIFVGKKKIYIKLRNRYFTSKSLPKYAERNSSISTITSSSNDSQKSQLQVHYHPKGS